MNNRICVTHVERSFGTGEHIVHVLRGIDLIVESGQIVALYGPSGSGKTTLLNLIGALDMPDRGEISVGAQDIVHMSAWKRAEFRRTQIGFIFQRDTLVPSYTALENIDLALRLRGLGHFDRQRRAASALAAVGLSAWANHLPDELSGGQRQRVAIARALALQPAVILADEPTGGLDTRTTQHILVLLRGFAAQYQTSFVIVSHDPLVMDFAHRAHDLDNGQLSPRPLAARETEYASH